MTELKVNNSTEQQGELQDRARQFGRNLFEKQRRERFGALELQERVYDWSRRFPELRPSIWDGYIQKSVEVRAAIKGRA